MAVALQALAGTASLEHAHADGTFDRDAQDAEETERTRSRALDALGAEDAASDDDRRVVW